MKSNVFDFIPMYLHFSVGGTNIEPSPIAQTLCSSHVLRPCAQAHHAWYHELSAGSLVMFSHWMLVQMFHAPNGKSYKSAQKVSLSGTSQYSANVCQVQCQCPSIASSRCENGVNILSSKP